MSQKIFITGASRGIGRAVALRYAQEGAEIFITARNEDNLKSLSLEIEKMGGKARFQKCDVSQKDEVFAAIDIAFEKMGSIDIAILNAGVGITNSFSELDTEKVLTTFNINFFGVLFAMERLIPKMKNTKGVKLENSKLNLQTREN